MLILLALIAGIFIEIKFSPRIVKTLGTVFFTYKNNGIVERKKLF